MTIQERISYLVGVLENGDARAFANKIGVNESVLSRLRRGKQEMSMLYYTRILNAYPEVRREWLFAGVGEPTKERQEKSLLLSEISALRKEVAELKEMVAKLEKSAER